MTSWSSFKTRLKLNTTGGDDDDEDDEGGGGGPAGSGGSSQPRPPAEARRKIKNARRKLLGENPASILIDDIAQVDTSDAFSFDTMTSGITLQK